MTLVISGHSFAYEMECVTRIFFPGEKIIVSDGGESGNDRIITSIKRASGELRLLCRVDLEGHSGEKAAVLSASAADSEAERALAVLLFEILCGITGTRPPWGILTGVRPVRFCRGLLRRTSNPHETRRILENDFLVSSEKVTLLLKTAEAEEAVLSQCGERCFSLYISIPFCPSRCLYCSFVSQEVGKSRRLIPEYVSCLVREIAYIGEIATKRRMKLSTVYIGGGTPTTLEAGDLARIMSAVNKNFDLSQLMEYSVEAGRPDTITAEKLRVIKEHSADRISVNPQTMNDSILREIGRPHSSEDIVKSFMLAREAGINNINMDIIAGLPGDSFESFKDTISKVLGLSPENITVHTLTVKRASELRERDDAYSRDELDIGACLDMARDMLTGSGYIPYYMYRQKGTRQNHENTGYSLPGFENRYNVFIMEEEHTILAAGAGAITKLCRPPDKIERVYNYKYPYEYITGFDEMLRRKSAIGEFYERYY